MEKQELRDRIWDALEESGEARFPFPPHGRIPNFAGADGAAERLAARSEWQEARTVKVNPDAPQLPVRRRALREGKTLYMAQPRLKSEKPFLRLEPAEVSDINEATTVSGVAAHGVPVGPDEMPGIDLIVSGSVAVTERGARIGKGEGYSDIEFAVLRELGLVSDDTPTATTVHELQIVDGEVGIEPHDVPMDLIVTPERAVRPDPREKPAGIAWQELMDERLDEIPLLRRMKPP